MTTLLHISASPRGAKSESLAIAETFLAAYRETHPDVEIADLGPVGRHAAGVRPGRRRRQDGGLRRCRPDGRGGHGVAPAPSEAFERFAAADAYLFSVPMWNAGIPYILKQFIDVVSQPGMVFGFDGEPGTPVCSPAARPPSSTPARSTDPGGRRHSGPTSRRRTCGTG